MALFGNKMQPTGEMTDAEQLAQLMQGNLKGQLSSADKLSALGALLKSVSRGSTTSPAQVIQNVQAQKMAEVQGRLQLQQLRQQSQRKAELDALKQQYVANVKDPQMARAIQLMSDDDFSKLIIEQNKAQAPTRLSFDPLGRPRDPFTGAIVNPTARLQGLPTVASDEEYNALPSGTAFVDPEGNIRSKP